VPLFTSGGLGLGLGLVSSGLGLSLGLKNLVMFTLLHYVAHSLTGLLIFVFNQGRVCRTLALCHAERTFRVFIRDFSQAGHPPTLSKH